MKRLLKIFVALIFLSIIGIALTPDKTIKATTKELAEETQISPFLANFIINTNVGRKIAYIAMKKETKKFFFEDDKKTEQ
jgi:hypothetical protein